MKLFRVWRYGSKSAFDGPMVVFAHDAEYAVAQLLHITASKLAIIGRRQFEKSMQFNLQDGHMIQVEELASL